MSSAPSQQSDPVNLHKQAIQYLQKGQFDQGIKYLKQALELNPSSSDLHKDLGTAYWQKGEPDKAEHHYEKAAQLSPDNASALNNYAGFLLSNERLKKAEKLLKRALKLEPNNPEILNNLGMVYYNKNNHLEAGPLFEKALKSAPNWANPYYNLGLVFKDLKEFEKADMSFKKAISLNQGHALAWLELGHLMDLGKNIESAKKCYEKALILYPDNDKSWTNLIGIYERTGKLDEADSLIEKAAAKMGENHPMILFAKSKVARRRDDYKLADELLQKVTKIISSESYKNAGVYFELAQINDKLNNYNKSFELFTKANALHSKNPKLNNYSFNTIPERIQSFEALAKSEYETINNVEPIDDQYSDPVFLVGFPRSGTTLLEQILKSHPDTVISEENPALDLTFSFGEEKHGADFIKKLPDMNKSEYAELRNYYFEFLSSRNIKFQNGLFIDKMPLNMIYTPMIRAIFPSSKFILALRHPCDCVLSCFMQKFSFNNSLIHTLDINSAAKFYNTTFTAWDTFSSRLDLSVYELKYEDLVNDLEGNIRKLLEYLELDWSDAVLDYDKTAKSGSGIYTPSYRQVTEKIYSSSTDRWKNYKDELEPIASYLYPWVKKYGYPE